MAFISDFVSQVFWLFKETAPFMLLGLFIAGLLRFLISEKRFSKAFGQDNLKSVTAATLFGIPLPLCSCSVLPMMLSLRKRGASKGATAAFLVSTPETGVDSISVTYALLDPIFTVARPVAALVSALVTGSLVNLFVRKGWDQEPGAVEEEGCGTASCEADRGQEMKGSLLKKACAYGYGPLMDDLTPLLILAFLASGLIAVLIPDGFFDNPVTRGWQGMFLMLLVGMPLYVCATSSTPLVASLMLKGLSPGAALVFLLAGPVTNVGTLIAVLKTLGRKVMVIYLLSTSAIALLMGGIIESIYRDLAIPVKAIVGTSSDFVPGPVKIGSLLVLAALMARSAVRTRLLSRWGERLRERCRPLGFDPLGKRAGRLLSVLVLLLYLLTSLSRVDVGEVGWVFTFGQVERDGSGTPIVRKPGLHLHLPIPFQRLVTGRPDEIRSVSFGFRGRNGADSPFDMDLQTPQDLDLEAEAQVMDGEESLVSLKFTVLYRLEDPYAYYFCLDDPDALVRGYAASAVRTVSSCRSTQHLLVGHRRELEAATRDLLQEELDALKCGVRLVRVSFIDVHAPPDVHFAFRDVASAGENKHQQELKGESAYLATLAEARGLAARIAEEAESDRHGRVNRAQGEATAFTERAAAYKETRELTRLRMYLETMGTALKAARVVFPLAPKVDAELWLGGASDRRLPFEAEKTSSAEEEQSRPVDAMDKILDPDWFRTLRQKQGIDSGSPGRKQ